MFRYGIKKVLLRITFMNILRTFCLSDIHESCRWSMLFIEYDALCCLSYQIKLSSLVDSLLFIPSPQLADIVLFELSFLDFSQSF